MATTIGNSGFEYTKEIDHNYSKRGSHTYTYVTVKNIKTGDVLFKLTGSLTYKPYAIYAKASKKFFGLDNKYYYIIVTPKYKTGTVDWGQIQSDGAVLRANRTILTILPFFPNYEKPKTTVPVKTPIIIKEPPNIPKVVTIPKTPVPGIVPVIPKFTGFKDAEEHYIKKETSWIKKLIKKIIAWIIKTLNR